VSAVTDMLKLFDAEFARGDWYGDLLDSKRKAHLVDQLGWGDTACGLPRPPVPVLDKRRSMRCLRCKAAIK
jgi:hypothetical protein